MEKIFKALLSSNVSKLQRATYIWEIKKWNEKFDFYWEGTKKKENM